MYKGKFEFLHLTAVLLFDFGSFFAAGLPIVGHV